MVDLSDNYLLRRDRYPQIYIVSGRKGIGKTFYSEQLVKAYNKKFKRKVLIFGAESKDWRFGKKISGKEIIGICKESFTGKGIYVIPDIIFSDLDAKSRMFQEVVYHFKNGLLVAEDFNKYETTAQAKKIISTLTSNRQKNADILIHLQSMARIKPVMFENCFYYRLYYQTDDVARYKQKLPSSDLFFIAQNLIQKKYIEGNIRFFVHINLNDFKITGDYSLDDYLDAVMQLIAYNPSTLYGKMNYLKMKGMKSSKKEAIKIIIKEYMQYSKFSK